jgi:hypothetical protein
MMVFTCGHNDNIACPDRMVFTVDRDDAGPLQKDEDLVYIVYMARLRVSGLARFEDMDAAARDPGFAQYVRCEHASVTLKILNRQSNHLFLSIGTAPLQGADHLAAAKAASNSRVSSSLSGGAGP